jgi:uncharacterized membrane protein YkvA (DUF1232 family)
MSKPKTSVRAARSTKKAGRSNEPKVSESDTDEIMRSAAYVRAVSGAEMCAKKPERLRKLLAEAMERVNYVPRGPFTDTWPYLLAMIRLIRSYHQEEYRDISTQHLLAIIAAISYFASPNNAIPDSVPILGQLDDALVIRLALQTVTADLDAFMAWETVKI